MVQANVDPGQSEISIFMLFQIFSDPAEELSPKCYVYPFYGEKAEIHQAVSLI